MTHKAEKAKNFEGFFAASRENEPLRGRFEIDKIIVIYPKLIK